MSKFHPIASESVDLDALKKRRLRTAIIEDFLLERSMNVIYAPAGSGKTWLCFALSNALASAGLEVAYIDTDNGVDILQDRGFDAHLRRMKIEYFNADAMDDSRTQIKNIIEKLTALAVGDYFDKCVIIMDSLSFFLDGGVYDEGKINRFVAFCKAIRRSGGTVVVINHTTKGGETMKGGGSIINAFDEVWEAKKIASYDDVMHFSLTPEKRRMKVRDVAFGVNTKTLELEPLDPVLASMSEEEKDFVERVKELVESDSYSQNALLKELGLDHGDRFGRESLAKFVGRFWSLETQGNKKLYKKLDTHGTPDTP